jgi:hypothetical protein
LTGAANEAFASGDLHRAQALYEEALEEAERLFALSETAPHPAPAPVIYNISCHNLAEMLD